MKENLKMVKLMEKGKKRIKQVIYMKEIGKKENGKEKE